MFKIAASPTYWATVEVPFRLEGGQTEIRKFEAEFERLPQADLDEMVARGRVSNLPDQEVVDRVFKNWRGVADEEGKEIECTAANRGRLFSIVPVRACVVTAFFKSIGGARAGN